MRLDEILNPRIINLELDVKTKDEALRELGNLLMQEGYIDDLETFVRDIYLREEEGITGMGNSIAIPHGKSRTVKKVGIAIGRSKNMIEWESYDELPVNLIFLFCVSDDDNFALNHMKLLAELAGKLGNDIKVEKLKKAESKEDLIQILIT